MVAALRKNLKSVRERLALLLSPLGKDGLLSEWEEGLPEEEGEGRDLEVVFRCVLSALHCLGDRGYGQLSEALGDVEHGEQVSAHTHTHARTHAHTHAHTHTRTH